MNSSVIDDPTLFAQALTCHRHFKRSIWQADTPECGCIFHKRDIQAPSNRLVSPSHSRELGLKRQGGRSIRVDSGMQTPYICLSSDSWI